MAKIIAITNQKGGVGKTTIATNLASQLQADGFAVMIVDLDPQGSATDWAAEQNESTAVPLVQMGKTLVRDLPRISSGYDYVIIDGAPQVAELAVAALLVADLVLVPVQPSPYDIWACAELVELITRRQQVTEGTPKAAFLVSRAVKNTNLSKEVIDALNEYGLPVLKNQTTQSVVYPEKAKEGGSVVSLDREHPRAVEMRNIAQEVLEHL